MAKKAKTEEKRPKGHYVKIETAIIVALIALVVGFFMGEIFHLSGPEPPAPVQTAPQPQQPRPSPQPAQAQGPTPEQASRILSLEQEVSKNPGNVETWTELANLYFDANQFGQAITAYNKSLELNPYDASVWTDLGVMYRRNGQPFEAIGAFNKAMDVDPKHQVSRVNKGIVLLHDVDDRQGAIDAWEELLKVDPAAKMPNGQPVKDLVDTLKRAQPAAEGS
jgi:cytochrome c-type biogenesis protein CcmH/NrfG